MGRRNKTFKHCWNIELKHGRNMNVNANVNVRKLLLTKIAKFRTEFPHLGYTVLCNKHASGQNPAIITMLVPSLQPSLPDSCLLGDHLCVLDPSKVQHTFGNKLDTLAASSFQ